MASRGKRRSLISLLLLPLVALGAASSTLKKEFLKLPAASKNLVVRGGEGFAAVGVAAAEVVGQIPHVVMKHGGKNGGKAWEDFNKKTFEIATKPIIKAEGLEIATKAIIQPQGLEFPNKDIFPPFNFKPHGINFGNQKFLG